MTFQLSAEGLLRCRSALSSVTPAPVDALPQLTLDSRFVKLRAQINQRLCFPQDYLRVPLAYRLCSARLMTRQQYQASQHQTTPEVLRPILFLMTQIRPVTIRDDFSYHASAKLSCSRLFESNKRFLDLHVCATQIGEQFNRQSVNRID